MAVASAGLYASLHPRQPRQHPTTQFFTGRMPFLPPNQQCQSTEGRKFINFSESISSLEALKGFKLESDLVQNITHTQPFYGSLDFVWTMPVRRHQKIHSPTHIIMVINHPLFASSVYYNPWRPLCSIYGPDSLFPQSLSKFSPFTLYSIPFFTQSLSSFHSICQYHRNLFCCSTEVMSSNPSVSLHSLLRTLSCSLTLHIHLTILISVH